jgi:hypothetical protein
MLHKISLSLSLSLSLLSRVYISKLKIRILLIEKCEFQKVLSLSEFLNLTTLCLYLMHTKWVSFLIGNSESFKAPEMKPFLERDR